MKYLMLIHAAIASDDADTATTAGCTPEDWIRYSKEMRDAGVWVYGNALADFTTATSVQVDADGVRTVTDGPFTETREVLGGFDVIDVPDLDAALDWAAKCPGSWFGGSVVVRPLADFDSMD